MTEHAYRPGDRDATSLDLLEDSQLRELGTAEAEAVLARRRDERLREAARARTRLAGLRRTH